MKLTVVGSLGSSTLLLRRGVAIDVLLLGGSLAGSRLGSALASLAILLDGLLATASFLGSGRGNSAIGGRHELVPDLGPGIASRARIAHSGELGELLVVDL